MVKGFLILASGSPRHGSSLRALQPVHTTVWKIYKICFRTLDTSFKILYTEVYTGESMKILLTGSSGYIGKNLRGYVHWHNLPYEFAYYDLVDGFDVLDPTELHRCVQGCDGIIHLAGISGIVKCEENPARAVEVNSRGTFYVASTAREMGIPFVLASSFSVEIPINVYGSTKKIAEAITRNNKGVALRIANVYGGVNYLETKGSVISYLVNSKALGEKPTIHEDGRFERDFIHVQDVCEALLHGLKQKPGIYRVCTGKLTSVAEIATMVGHESWNSIPNPRVDEKVEVLPDWEPKISLKKGLGMRM